MRTAFFAFFVVKTSYLQNLKDKLSVKIFCVLEGTRTQVGRDSRSTTFPPDDMVWYRSSFLFMWNWGYWCSLCTIEQNDYFRYFRLLMPTWSDSICENTFETSHVRFIHENFSVLITTPLHQIQQNLLRKETCPLTAKHADIVLQRWIEEYLTPP